MFRRQKILILALSAGVILPAQADNFTKANLKEWRDQFMAAVREGEKLWNTPLGTNNVSCGTCHPDASNTHPETYPKFQKQLGRVAALRDMINWCIAVASEGPMLAVDDPKMYALESYMSWERRGVSLNPGKH
jgi:cytochrome c